jgi:PST family polysaccharide transporter
MLSMGGVLTCNGVVVYLAYNTEKILLGRFWGAVALGLYGRAYQLISIPSDLLINAIATVAFPSLSRLQNDPERLERAFLRGYSVVLSCTIPTTVTCAVFAPEIVRIMLGEKWAEAVPIFRLMTPTIIAFALINPLAWFLISSGRARRSMYIGFLIAPFVIVGAAMGMTFGPRGVALAFSTMMTLLTVPVILWARAGTTMTVGQIWGALQGPLTSGLVAGISGYAVRAGLAGAVPVSANLMVGALFVYGVYFLVLLFPFGQRVLYVDLMKHLWRPANQGIS